MLYNVIIGTAKTPDLKADHTMFFNSCFGTMFSNTTWRPASYSEKTKAHYARNGMPLPVQQPAYPYSYSVFRFMEGMTTELANWYLTKIVIPAMPERLRPYVSIQQITKKEYDNRIDLGHFPEGYPPTAAIKYIANVTPWTIAFF